MTFKERMHAPLSGETMLALLFVLSQAWRLLLLLTFPLWAVLVWIVLVRLWWYTPKSRPTPS